MKLSITILALYAFASADCTTNEYCFKNKDSFVILEMVKREGECYRREEVEGRIIKYYYGKEEEVSLSDEYKFCRWSSGVIKAKVSLDGNLTLTTSFGFLETSIGRQTKHKEYDSVAISGASSFDCYSGNGLSSSVNCLGKNSVKEKAATRTGSTKGNCAEAIGEENFEEENGKYNELILPILKNSIGKIFTTDIAVEVRCPRDANDTNYTENKTLKINRPIVVIGECPNKMINTEK
jgi:hypothetical protein